MSSIAESRHHF
jgi:hypothetical protein